VAAGTEPLTLHPNRLLAVRRYPVYDPGGMSSGWITLQQIADKAGVSRSTASRALRRIPGTAAATVSQVEAAARALGYAPDPQLSELTIHLRRRKTVSDRPIIACVHTLPGALFEKYSTKALEGTNVYIGAEAQAYKLGFSFEPFAVDPAKMKESRLSSILRSRGIRLVVIAPAFRAFTPIDLRWEWFTSVAIGHSTKLPPFHRVAPHQYQGMIDIVQRLFDLGYRRLGFVMVPATDLRTQGNYRAAYLMLRSIHGPERFAPILVSEGDDRDTFERWLNEHRLDAVIKAGQAIPLLEWLDALRRRVPQEIGYADTHLLRHERTISGIYQNPSDVGAAAVDLVVSLAHDNQKGLPKVPKNVQVSGEWVEGETTRRVGKACGSIWAGPESAPRRRLRSVRI